MPGFPLAAIGAGIGQFVQQYKQQQELAMRQQAFQLEMQNQQRAQKARQTLGGLDLSQALGGGGISPVGGGGLPGSGTMPAPPQAAPAPAPMAVASPSPGPSGDNIPYQEGRYNPELDVPVKNTPEGVQFPSDPGGYAAPGSPGTTSLDDPAAPTAVPDAAAAPSAAAPSPGGSGGNLMASLPDGRQMDLGSLMARHLDLGAIQKAIIKQKPGLDPEVAWEATEKLYKLAQTGSRQDQQMSALLIKTLMPSANFTLGEAGRNERAAMASGDRAAGRTSREGIAANAQAGAAGRQQTGIAAAGERQNKALAATAANNQARIDAAKTKKDPGERRQALQAEQRAIQAQLNPPGIGAQQPSEADRAALTRQLREVIGELRKISGLGPLPPQPSMPLPGGGASAPVP